MDAKSKHLGQEERQKEEEQGLRFKEFKRIHRFQDEKSKPGRFGSQPWLVFFMTFFFNLASIAWKHQVWKSNFYESKLLFSKLLNRFILLKTVLRRGWGGANLGRQSEQYLATRSHLRNSLIADDGFLESIDFSKGNFIIFQPDEIKHKDNFVCSCWFLWFMVGAYVLDSFWHFDCWSCGCYLCWK